MFYGGSGLVANCDNIYSLRPTSFLRLFVKKKLKVAFALFVLLLFFVIAKDVSADDSFAKKPAYTCDQQAKLLYRK